LAQNLRVGSVAIAARANIAEMQGGV
jgi:hypothetical protein